MNASTIENDIKILMDSCKTNLDSKLTFWISLYLNLPRTGLLYKYHKICENRIKLYKLLEEINFESYQLEWQKNLFKAMLEKNLVEFLVLLDKDKVQELEQLDQGLYSDKEQLATSVLDVKFFQNCYEDDEIGHFLLALVCSTNEDLKNLFISLETQWFQLKFASNIPEDYIIDFLNYQNIKIQETSRGELLNMKNELGFYDLDLKHHIPIIFKVPFTEAPNMLTDRDVIIKNGKVYFPNKHKYVSLFLQHFVMTKWREKLDSLSRYWEKPDRDERMDDLVNDILPHMKKLLKNFGQLEPGNLTMENIDEHSRKFFPLCMYQLHHFLEQNNHLKHNARKQYAVFLKNAGMSYEDAMELFESEMTKKMSEEDFTKRRYFYYFSHVFGEVGGRVNYLPQSCDGIINDVPSLNQEHGCPFAHYDIDNLKSILVNSDIGKQTVTDIIEEKRKDNYQKACCLYFREKVKSKTNCVSSPNSYYSCALETCGTVDIEDIFTDPG